MNLLFSPDNCSHILVGADRMNAYCVMESLAYRPLKYMASPVVMDDHEVRTLPSLLPFLCNVKPCIDHAKTTWSP